MDLDDFFVGIGDINSPFLPKLDPSSIPGPKPPASSTEESIPSSDEKPPVTVSPSELSSSSEATANTADQDAKDAEADAAMTKAAEVLDAQLEERPLAKMQEELSEKGSQETSSSEIVTDEKPGEPPQTEAEPKKEKPVRKALLTNNDHELLRVKAVSKPRWCDYRRTDRYLSQLLDHVHKTFYDAYDARQAGKSSKADNKLYDVRVRALFATIRSRSESRFVTDYHSWYAIKNIGWCTPCLL
jgi:RNA polymerase II subunit A C-terminal domain phosphatase